MKTVIIPLLGAALLCSTHTSSAEWVSAGVCYVWAGNTPPAEAAADMLPGRFYDYSRGTKGNCFTYSGVYRPENNTIGRALPGWGQVDRPRGNAPTNSPDELGQFVYTLRELGKGKRGLLKKYYRHRFTVATPHIYLPPSHTNLEKQFRAAQSATTNNPASDFLPDDASLTNRPGKGDTWIGIFRGRVVAPKTMTFRFLGAADDALTVRFNDKLVLETGYFAPSQYKGNGQKDKACKFDSIISYQQELAAGKHPDKKGYTIRKLKSTPYCNQKFLGITGGFPIKVTEGKTYPIEIIIGNYGGMSLFYLLTQEVTPNHDEPLKLFRTNGDKPAPAHLYSQEKGPAYAEDSEIWKIADSPAEPARK